MAIDRNQEVITSPSAAEIERYQMQLETVATLFPSDRAYAQIEGGISVALHVGEFYRQHADIDIAVWQHELLQVEGFLRERSYRLFSRNAFHALEYAPFDTFYEVHAAEILNRDRVKRLTAVKVNKAGRFENETNALNRFDLHIHMLKGKDVYLDRGPFAFPLEQFENTTVIPTRTGSTVTVASATLMAFYKMAGRRPRHLLDLKKLQQSNAISAGDLATARALFEASRLPSDPKQPDDVRRAA